MNINHFDKNMTLPLSNEVLTGAHCQTKPAGFHFGAHIHTTIEIYRILSGSCSMDIGTATVPCKAGDFIMILPNVVHSFSVGDDMDCEFQQIHFRPDTFANIILDDSGIYPISMMHAVHFYFKTYFRHTSDTIFDDCLQKIIDLHTSADSLFSAANINVCLMNIMLHILDQKRPDQPTAEPNIRNSYVAYTLDYIHQNYMHKILQSDIADQLQISVRYLSTLFKKYMGITLSNYINIYRINKSIELMQSDKSLTEISQLVGLKDSQHYSKLFYNIIGEPPSIYRKSYIKS